MRRGEHPCEVCKKPTDFCGWYFVSHRPTKRDKVRRKLRFKKVNVWWCKEHYLVRMFNLWPFTCTKKCQTDRAKKLGLHFRPEDHFVWMNMITVIVPAIPKSKMKPMVPHAMKPISPKCPHCGKGMKLAKEASRLF